MNLRRVYIYKQFERFWHWSQSALILFLALTGFEIHGSLTIFGFEQAVYFHNQAAYALIALIVFAVFWHVTTGAWQQYIPTGRKLLAQMRYYAWGIFSGEAHPPHKTPLSKLNPIQILVYDALKLFMIPLMVISGLLYLYHKTLDANDVVVISKIELSTIAIAHTFGAFLLIAFVIVHVYMTTTGRTPVSNLRAMITGYEVYEAQEARGEASEAAGGPDHPSTTETAVAESV
ncbi:MAG: cytochrome b/b6 domain-containing protein [Bacteroidia bacterium]